MHDIVFIHGLGLSSVIWSDASKYIAHPLLLDLPGFGRGPRHDNINNYNFGSYWQYIKEKLSFEIKNTFFVLHSMSSAITIEMLRHQEIPAGIILVEGNLIPEDSKWSCQIANMEEVSFKKHIKLLNENGSVIFRRGINRQFTRDELSELTEGYRLFDPQALRMIAREVCQYTVNGDIVSAINKMHTKKYYIRGSLSEKWEEGWKLLGDMSIESCLLKKCGHFPMLDNPEEFYSAINKGVNF